jgi:nitrogen fixation-related uncharacterized protein
VGTTFFEPKAACTAFFYASKSKDYDDAEENLLERGNPNELP